MSPMKPGRGQAPRNPPPKAQRRPPPPPANSGMGGHRRVTTTPEPSTSPNAQAPPAPPGARLPNAGRDLLGGITMEQFGQRMARLTDAVSDQDITDRVDYVFTDILASCAHPQHPGHRIGDKAICTTCHTASHVVATGVRTVTAAAPPPPPDIHFDGVHKPDRDPIPLERPELRARRIAVLEAEVMDTTPQEWVEQACAAFDQEQLDLAAGKPGPPPSDPGQRARY